MIPSPRAKGQTFAASQRKTFRSCLCQLLRTEFPGTFGPAITALFAEKIGRAHV